MAPKKRVSCPELTKQIDNLAHVMDGITDLKLARDLAYCLSVVLDEFGKHYTKKASPPVAVKKVTKAKPRIEPELEDETNIGMTKEELADFEKFLNEDEAKDPTEEELERILKGLAKGRTKGDK